MSNLRGEEGLAWLAVIVILSFIVLGLLSLLFTPR